jgi:hypothetical protein
MEYAGYKEWILQPQLMNIHVSEDSFYVGLLRRMDRSEDLLDSIPE